jgi:hypothetical protein
MSAVPIRNPSSEDIYENLDDADDRVPSQRRITVRVGRPRPCDVHDLETLPPPSPPAFEARVAEARTSDAPEQSLRRVKAARPVSGAPTAIQEPLTEAILRDPRRD